MNVVTKMKVEMPASDVFEAFVDPKIIGAFWFSTSSERWAAGKEITLTYKEYNATVQIHVTEVVENKKIVFSWGSEEDERTTTITLQEEGLSTIVEVVEDGFNDEDPALLLTLMDQKEGWVFMLTCLKAYLEFGVTTLRGGLTK